MHLIILTALFGISAAQFVPTPAGFSVFSYSGSSGFFNSHAGYLQYPYSPGWQMRYVVTVPQGQRAQLSIDVTNPATFKIRAYDFGVLFGGNSAAQISQACSVNSYVALGPSGTSYLSITMSNTSAVRTFVSSSNVAVIDFCVNPYNSGNDPSMLGFRAFWSSVPQSPSPTAAPAPPTPSPTPAPTTPAPSTQSCGRPQTLPAAAVQLTRIVGGVVSPANSWPWACALIHNGYQFCDCSILSSQWIITAGHCVAEFTQASFIQTVTVYYGSQNLLSSQKATVLKMIPHPQYDTPTGSTSHDVALVKISSPIQNFPNPNVAPVCLPSQPIGSFAAPLTGNYNRPLAYVAGWGTVFEGQTSSNAQIGSGSDQLLQTTIEMYSRQDCISSFGSSFPDTTLCGGLNQGGRDSCQGDSGGPLVMPQQDGSYALFGVVSFGQGCAEAGHPGAYSDVYTLSPWIKSTMQSN